MTHLGHHRGIRCIHLHGNESDLWCRDCRRHWLASLDDGMTQADYERECDLALTYAVLTGLESGAIPLSPLLDDFDLGMAFLDRVQPSSN